MAKKEKSQAAEKVAKAEKAHKAKKIRQRQRNCRARTEKKSYFY